ncbi:MAG: general secretion pathway protein GspB [Gammaproteobacteria bacterium]|nr:general secretion pathway protein GspB [Gammaproteobacteria bacterium]
MSFILDALKKSETDRQQRSTAEFSKVPASTGPGGVPGWLLVLGILLAINLVVLLGLFLKSDDEPRVQTASVAIEPAAAVGAESLREEPEATPAADEKTSFARQVEEAKRSRPPVGDARTAPPSQSVPEPAATLPRVSEEPSRQVVSLPTIYELVADGSIALPELHLDIHVYSDVPEERFIFINMSKHREQSQLSEGPLVEEITSEGVVLTYRGKSFLLPRD